MRLKKRQRERLLSWITEGLETHEINERASIEEQPFQVSRSQVDFYRKSRTIAFAKLTQSGEFGALNSGLARKDERVRKLQELAALMELDLFGERLWTDQIKSIGSGEDQMKV